MGKSVLGAGLVTVDHVFISKSNRGTRRGYTYLGSTGGGSVSNTLCMLSLLGNKTYVFGIVGNDYPERIVNSDFAKFNVDSSLLISRGSPKDPRKTRQYSHIVYPKGKHSFKQKCLRCGEPFPREFQMTAADLAEKARAIARKVDVVHIDRANRATKELVRIAIDNQHYVSFDVGFGSYGKYRKTVSEILELSTLVKISEPIFKVHIGATGDEGIRLWWKKYPENKYLLVTRGERGVYGSATIESEKKIFDLKAIQCEHLRDCAGSGDIFTAVAINNLLLGRPLSDEKKLHNYLGLAQALASLNCSLYGARSLQFLFRNQGISYKRIMDIAKRIFEEGKSGNSLLPLIGLRDRDRFHNPSRLAPFNVCPVCGAPLSARSASRMGKEIHVEHVDLKGVPWCMVEGFLVGKNQRSKLDLLTDAPSIFIGSGGSLSASAFGEQLVLRMIGRTAMALPPFEFEGLKSLREDTNVWLLSYGGSNPDIMGAAMNVAKLGITNCIVLTGARTSELTKFAEDNSWHTIFLRAEERGFVSTMGMLTMMSALTGIFGPEKEIEEIGEFFNESNLRRILKSADRTSMEIATRFSDRIDSTHIIALGSGWGWPALVDFESKIVEGGVCTIEISEIKNFTHGRYINALSHRQNRHFILFSSPLEDELVFFFDKKLKRYFPQRLDVLRTDLPDVRGALDLVIQSMLLAFRLGEKTARNLLKPKYPPEARGLYGWEPSSRRTKKK